LILTAAFLTASSAPPGLQATSAAETIRIAADVAFSSPHVQVPVGRPVVFEHRPPLQPDWEIEDLHLAPEAGAGKTATPDHGVFNGLAGSLSGTSALQAAVGETVRLFFGVGGPNLASSLQPTDLPAALGRSSHHHDDDDD
jgi:hypothetical protein